MCEGKMDYFQRRTVAQLFVWLQSDFIFFFEKQTSANKQDKKLYWKLPFLPGGPVYMSAAAVGSKILIISAMIQVIKLIKINVSLPAEIHCRIKGESLPALYAAPVILFSLRK